MTEKELRKKLEELKQPESKSTFIQFFITSLEAVLNDKQDKQ